MNKINCLDQIIICLENLRSRGNKTIISREVWEKFAGAEKTSASPRPVHPLSQTDYEPRPHSPVKVETKPELPVPSPTPREQFATAAHNGTDEERWAALEKQVANCTLCALGRSRLKPVFGTGDHHAEIMLIGMVPNGEEETENELFTGKSGALLNKMLEAMGLSKKTVYTAGIVKCRPPDDRAVSTDEAERCVYYLSQQIELVKPKVIVLLGFDAVRHAVRKELIKTGITALVGKWLDVQGIPAMPIFHPSYLIRLENNPEKEKMEKKRVWEALKLVMQKYQSPNLPR